MQRRMRRRLRLLRLHHPPRLLQPQRNQLAPLVLALCLPVRPPRRSCPLRPRLSRRRHPRPWRDHHARGRSRTTRTRISLTTITRSRMKRRGTSRKTSTSEQRNTRTPPHHHPSHAASTLSHPPARRADRGDGSAQQASLPPAFASSLSLYIPLYIVLRFSSLSTQKTTARSIPSAARDRLA